MDKELVITIIKGIAAQLEVSTGRQFEALSSGRARLEIRIVENAKAQNESPKDWTVQRSSKALAEKLNGLITREEGTRYLEEMCNTKNELLSLAKCLDLSVQKKDTIKRLQEKIIEATIGFRIRSAAIQGISRATL